MSLREFVSSRGPELRRAAFLLCGDWDVAGGLAGAALARLVAESHRGAVEDPDGFVYGELMDTVRRRPRRREHLFAAPASGRGDAARTILVLDALHRLSTRCRAVLVLRHRSGFAVDEVADLLGLPEERVAQYDAAGRAALDNLLALGGDPVRTPIAEALAQALAGEPPAGDDIEAVFRRAVVLRRRRLRGVVAVAAAVAVLVTAGGYGLTSAAVPETVRPETVRQAAAARGPEPPPDPVLTVLRPAATRAGVRIVPREPARGEGWRRYAAVDRRGGHPRGLIEISVHAAADRFCFPVRADRNACARPGRTGGVDHVRYADDRDVDWQVVEVIARRLSDGRVLAVMATGERGTGDARVGRPPLTAREAATLAADPALMDAFDHREHCARGDAACPLLAVPVPAGG